LLSYATIPGISTILSQMNRRTQRRTQHDAKMNFAVMELEQYYTEFEEEFTSFFAELISFSETKRNQL